MHTKELQGQLWSRVATSWVKHIEPTFIPMYKLVLEQLMLHEEDAILDAGCGAGLFLSMASATGAIPHGIDASPTMLSVAKQRNPTASLLLEDLEALPYIDGTFDAVVAFNSFQYAGSFTNALAEARRVVKRHGKVVFGIWASEENCDSRIILKALEDLVPARKNDTLTVLDEEGQIEAICRKVGLRVKSLQAACCPWSFNSDSALLDGIKSTPAAAIAIEEVGEKEVEKTIIQHAQPYSMTDDVYYLQNYFRIFITEKI